MTETAYFRDAVEEVGLLLPMSFIRRVLRKPKCFFVFGLGFELRNLF